METVKTDNPWNIVGHERAARSLRRAVGAGSVSHAYLFTGPSGVGRTTMARALAAALLCQGEGEPPCGACRACHLVAGLSHPDLHIVQSEQPGSRLKIEQVRDLQRQLALTPVEGNWRVAILRRFVPISLPFYIVHQSLLIAIGYSVLKAGLSLYPAFFAIVSLTFVSSWLFADFGVRPWRTAQLLFGMKGKLAAR